MTRRLPDTDLARAALLPRESRLASLRQVKGFRPPLTYKPVQAERGDIMNIQPALYAPAPRTPWAVIEQNIGRRCKMGQDELKANVAVGKALHTFFERENITAAKEEFFPWPITTDISVNYWVPAILNWNQQLYVCHIDPRRARGLNRPARQFAFSMMNERIRQAHPDFETVKFLIIRLRTVGDERAVRIYTDEGLSLLSHDEIERAIRDTYSDWEFVLNERRQEQRRAGGRGPLL